MKKPNVLFLLTDDQRFDTIAAVNNKDIKTPNLDRLVKSGVTFNKAYIPGGTSGAVCMPSRAMLNSGKTLFHLYKEGDEIPKSDVTMGEMFRKNGYRTIGIGKWHNGTESYARSFEDGDNIFFGGMWDHWNVPVCSYHENGIYDKCANFTVNFQHSNHPMPMICDKLSVGVHSTELFTDTAVDFLNKIKDDDRPFFMYVAYLAPHDPRTMPEQFKNMYNPDEISLPENFMTEHPFYYGIDCDNMRDEGLAAFPRSESEIRRHICDYYSMISHIDFNVGKLLGCLEETGRLENTIIVFTGDNGLAVGQHGLMGKQSVYDHSVHVPLLISGGGIPKNIINNDYVYLLDIFPTLCELIGAQIPESVEGKSFAAALDGKSAGIREDLYFNYTGLIRSVQDKKYKLIEYKEARNNSQLFDIENDPHELHNLFGEPQYTQIVARLRRRMTEYRAEWEDNTENPHSKAFWDTVEL